MHVRSLSGEQFAILSKVCAWYIKCEQRNRPSGHLCKFQQSSTRLVLSILPPNRWLQGSGPSI